MDLDMFLVNLYQMKAYKLISGNGMCIVFPSLPFRISVPVVVGRARWDTIVLRMNQALLRLSAQFHAPLILLLYFHRL